MADTEITIIGAGATGLSIAKYLSEQNKEVILLDKEPKWGMGISSRNSEVLHAGLYYPSDSLKTEFCIEGNRLIRNYCKQKGIEIKENGKLIVGWTKEHQSQLESMFKHASEIGVKLQKLTKNRISDYEPSVKAEFALFSPSTAVFDVSSFLHSLYRDAENAGATGLLGVKVTDISQIGENLLIHGTDIDGEEFELETEVIINSAGLYSDFIAQKAGFDIKRKKLELHWCKGDYFGVSPEAGNFLRPVYPLPDKYGLGIHITPDIGGQIKLGPDTEFIPKIENYEVSPNKQDIFFNSVSSFFPSLTKDHIFPLMSGIRPKLQGPDDSFKDFYIKKENLNFINLIGIESPGLTASMAIGKYVSDLL